MYQQVPVTCSYFLDVSRRSWSSRMSAPWKGIVFALLVLDWKHWAVRMKLIWFLTCPLGACQVVQDKFSGWGVLARWVSGCPQTLGVSSLYFLSLQCQIYLLYVPVQCWYESGFTLAFQMRVIWAPQMVSQQVSPFFSVLHCPHGLGKFQACPFHDVVFPPLLLSALSSSPFYCASPDGFGQTWWLGDMTISLQFASLYDGQEVFVWSNCLLDLGTDFLVSNMVFI